MGSIFTKIALKESFLSFYKIYFDVQLTQMKSEMKSELSSLRMKPKVAVVFGTGAPEQYTAHSHVWEDHLPRCQHTWLVNTEHVSELLPRDCVTIGTTSRGIVGLDHQRKGVEVENLDDSTRSIKILWGLYRKFKELHI